VAGATAELCDRGFKSILLAVKTDVAGRFQFPRAKRGQRYCLHAWFQGLDTGKITVRIWPLAKSEIHLKRPVGN
jgi:hypothetical protein